MEGIGKEGWMGSLPLLFVYRYSKYSMAERGSLVI
jgi:hypothetical protein